jgi:hypothetical protein
MSEAQTLSETESPRLVYIRPVSGAEIINQIGEGGPKIEADAVLYAVHLEDGTRMAVFSERTAAFAAARDHGADPVSVH